MTIRRAIQGALLVLLTLSGTYVVPRAAMQRPPAATSASELEEGRRRLRRGDNFEALRHLRRANDLAGGRCVDCLIGMADAMFAMKAWANVLETCQAALAAAPDNPTVQGRVHGLRAQVLLVQAETDASKYKEAEAEFRQAVAFDPNNEYLHFGFGVSLLKLGMDEEGVAELKRFLDIRDIGPTADDARAMIANPRRGREAFVPEFDFKTVSGVRMTPESMRGNVVLFDFWSTDCRPCEQAVPAIRKLLEKYTNAPFVVVSIGADEDESAWRRFTAKNNMTWPQLWDRQRRVAGQFRVGVYPSYVLAGKDGVERLRVTGTGLHQSRALTSAIEKELAPAP